AFTDRSIVCSELAVSGERRSVRRMAVFSPGTALFDKPDATGQALAGFLRQHRFRSSRAVVGVPARWLLSGEREVPPADAEQVRAVLRLHAERLSLAEQGEMVFDYPAQVEAGRGGKVLLIGIQRQRLERIEAVLDAAGIRVAAIMPTAVALASAVREPSDQPMLVLSGGGAELVWQTRGGPRLLRHVSTISLNGHGAPTVAPLGSELRRTVALVSTNGAGPARELFLWDGVGLSADQVAELANRLGVAVRNSQGLAALGVQAEPQEGGPAGELPGQFAPATALALVGTGHGAASVDFKHSRLAVPRKKRFGRRSVWTIALTATLGLTLGSMGWSLHRRQAELAALVQLIADNADSVKEAEKMNERVAYARKFFPLGRARMLDGLREITLAFPEYDSIWVTGVTLRENAKGQCTGQIVGKATDARTIQSLIDQLQRNPAFAEVRTVQITEVNAPGGRSKEQSFTISFVYLGSE
ncbi:MAG: PilN domain-containing protein, partial [Phycisphaerae bacterium]